MSIQLVKFQLASGEEVTLPFNEDGVPLPAESDHFKMETAGFVTDRPVGSSQTAMSWGFSFTCKKNLELTFVVVEEVLCSNQAILMIRDESPSLLEAPWSKHGVWLNNVGPYPVAPDSTPWLFQAGPTCFLFKITIGTKEHTPVVLLQPSYFTESTKALFIKQAQSSDR